MLETWACFFDVHWPDDAPEAQAAQGEGAQVKASPVPTRQQELWWPAPPNHVPEGELADAMGEALEWEQCGTEVKDFRVAWALFDGQGLTIHVEEA